MLRPELERWAAQLPIGPALRAVAAALAGNGCAVLQAPPGAGKSTLVPLALIDAPWLAGRRIVMLEPRRLAARMAARRMAEMCNETAGETVGYRTRLESKVGPGTRIEVVTEGILLRRLQRDPALDGVGLLIFDEFHERSLDADLGLALSLEARRYLREDLRLLVMSATLDAGPVAEMLGAPVVTSEGRSFPVVTQYLERPPPDRLEQAVANAIHRALDEETGSILVFLPGGREIRRVARLLAADLPPDAILAPLYGDLASGAQDEAIRPAPSGRRKIVLATSIAETSLTIEGIRVVIDSGLRRAPRFEPQSGMTRLVTMRLSQAASDQRRGRAGRLEAGVCYRLWREAEQAQLTPHTPPEILDADLAPLALGLAQWGSDDVTGLSWLDPPPAPALAQARELLGRLGALDGGGKITPHGREMTELGVHPRLAHMILTGRRRGFGALACAVAALIEERDIVRASPGQGDIDLRHRVDLVAGGGRTDANVDRGALERVRQQARQWRRQLRLPDDGDLDIAATGRVLALAYPDRIGQARPGSRGSFRLSNGRGAEVAATDPLAGEEFLAIADLDGERRSARIFLAAPLTRDDLLSDFADQLASVEEVVWNSREEAVSAQRQRRLGALVVKDERWADPPAETVAAAVIEGIRELGLAALPWPREAMALRDRVEFLRRLGDTGGEWPDFSDAGLSAGLEVWLAPYLGGVTRRSHFSGIDLAEALRSRLDWEQRQALDKLAPTLVTVPSGSRVAIDYGAGEVPVLAVRLQEMFGARETPAVAGGRVPLLLHLLSPAGRPLQVTRDLGGFWTGSYPAVRSDMRGRYPKHPWPEDPLVAAPTARAKRPGERTA